MSADQKVDYSPSASSESFNEDTGYTRVIAENGSSAAYQDAVGAPVESSSPLGYNVGWATVIFLNINQLIGTGIFSTRKLTIKSTYTAPLAHKIL